MSNFKRFVTWLVAGAGLLAMTFAGGGVAMASGGNDWNHNGRNQVNPLVRTNQFDFNRNRDRDRDDFRRGGNNFVFVDSFNNRNRNGQVRLLCRYLRNHIDSRADFQAYLRLCLNNHQIQPWQFNQFSSAFDRGNDRWNRDGRRGDLRDRDFSEVISLSEQSSFNFNETVSQSSQDF